MLEAAPLILGIAIAVGIFCLISFILIGCSIRIVDVVSNIFPSPFKKLFN